MKQTEENVLVEQQFELSLSWFADEPTEPKLKKRTEDPYQLAIHSVKVRRTGVTVEAKALWDLGQSDWVINHRQ